jgi:hypothetical protein
MDNADKKFDRFNEARGEAPARATSRRLSERDGLLESTKLINQKLVDGQGRQLLREEDFDNID